MHNLILNILGKYKHHRNIVLNFSYLAIVQIINIFLTLATYPYLIRVLGKELFGLVVFAQAIIAYLIVLVSFGFNIAATKEISINRDNKAKLNQIFSSIIILKGILFLISFGLLFIAISYIPEAKDNKILFILSMFACFYEFIYPSWYFQGMEKMKYVTLITLISKFTFFILTFVFISSKNDYLLVPLFNGFGSVLAGIISSYIVITKEKIVFSFQPLRILWKYFYDSIAFFISYISIQIYVNANKIIIGSFLGMAEVAYFDLAEKIVLLMKLPQAIFNQTIFPKISNNMNLNFVRKSFLYSTSGNIVLFLICLILAPIIVSLLGGRQMIESTNLLRWLALTVPVNGISSFLSIQILIPFGYKKAFTKIILASVSFYLFIIAILYIYNTITLYSIISSTIATEIFTTIVVILICKKKNVLWKSSNTFLTKNVLS